jgi:hypothetical protein
MRGLAADERIKLRRQADRLERFLSERMPALADFAERPGLPESAMIVTDTAPRRGG